LKKVYFCQNKGGEKGREIIHFENKKLDVVGFENFKKKDFFCSKGREVVFFYFSWCWFYFFIPSRFFGLSAVDLLWNFWKSWKFLISRLIIFWNFYVSSCILVFFNIFSLVLLLLQNFANFFSFLFFLQGRLFIFSYDTIIFRSFFFLTICFHGFEKNAVFCSCFHRFFFLDFFSKMWNKSMDLTKKFHNPVWFFNF